MNLKWEGDIVHGSYIRFVHTGQSESGKTMIWRVENELDRIFLGSVKWFSKWRTYAFDAEPDIVFEKTCLRDIAQFCEELTEEHRNRQYVNPTAEIHNQPSKNP